jgi:Protein of unknown function (DUF2442)
MLKDIVAVQALPNYRLRLRFEDGVEGEVAFPVPFEGVFAPLRDEGVFAAVQVNAELGTIVWPNGADLDPDVLHGLVTGAPAKVRERA